MSPIDEWGKNKCVCGGGGEACPKSIQPHDIKKYRLLLKKIQEKLYIGQWCLSPLQSRHLGTSHSSPHVSSTIQNTLQNPLLVSPLATPSYFPKSHWWSEVSYLSKVILILAKLEFVEHQIWYVGGLIHLGALTFHQKTMHKKWCMGRCVVVIKLPITIWP